MSGRTLGAPHVLRVTAPGAALVAATVAATVAASVAASVVLGGCLMTVDDNAWRRREAGPAGEMPELGLAAEHPDRSAPADHGLDAGPATERTADAQSPLRADPCGAAAPCVAGARQCADAGLQTCEQTDAGCTHWGAAVPCGAGQTCTIDECVTHCSADGVAAGCDPIVNSGCPLGQCYLLSSTGTACRCPAGTATSGSACNTTAECAPTLVCIGGEPPGICRPLCDPAAPQCPGADDCTPIDGLADFGFCR